MTQHLSFTCVPVVVAAGPGQLGAEGEDEVEQSPGQNNDVRHTAVEEDQLSTIAYTCRARFGIHILLETNITKTSLYTLPKLLVGT